jgi:2-oxoglutarate dehydrogenase E2 component (dihydrolipoamide succinyltransferase)
MITRIVIPQAFENMEEATIGAWLKSEGDSVTPGDALCELITEKTTFPLEAEGSGVLRQIAVNEKSIVPVGAVLASSAKRAMNYPTLKSKTPVCANASPHPKKSRTQVTVPNVAPIAAASTQARPPLAHACAPHRQHGVQQEIAASTSKKSPKPSRAKCSAKTT